MKTLCWETSLQPSARASISASAEKVAIDRATKRWATLQPDDRTPPRIGAKVTGENVLELGSPHDDAGGWSAAWGESFGTGSAVLIDNFMRNAGDIRGLGLAGDDGQSYVKAAREAGAFVAALKPQSEVETALALQMYAAHEMTMKLSGHAFRTGDRAALNDYSRMMNQTMRTFSAQAEALHKLRTGGKQVHEVRYVYVDARTQTVINEGGGPLSPSYFNEQPHAPGEIGAAIATSLPMWGQDASGGRVPSPRDQGQESVPDAWGEKSGRSDRRAQRQLHLRAVDGGDPASPINSPGDGEALSADAA